MKISLRNNSWERELPVTARIYLDFKGEFRAEFFFQNITL